MTRTSKEEKQRRAMFANMGNRRFRSSKRTGQQIRKQTKRTATLRDQKTTTKNVSTQANVLVVKDFPKKRDSRRQDVTTFEDSQGNIITVQQSEESAKYTPSNTETVGEKVGEDSAKITKLGGRNPRNVSETTVNVFHNPEQQELSLNLEERFKKWQKTKDPENRLSVAELRIIAKSNDVPSAGITRTTLEQRLTKQDQERKNPKPPPFREKFTASVTKKTEEEKAYFQRLRTSDISSEKKEIIIESTKKVNKENRHGNSTPLKTLRPELKKKGLTRFEQDVGLIQLQRERKIDLQVASFANTLDPKIPIIPDNDRNPLYFVTLRR